MKKCIKALLFIFTGFILIACTNMSSLDGTYVATAQLSTEKLIITDSTVTGNAIIADAEQAIEGTIDKENKRVTLTFKGVNTTITGSYVVESNGDLTITYDIASIKQRYTKQK